ncbi:MAG: sigma-70 family RNA polymerase sigma factor [Actinobacteria bacterium]|nr:sigma-70 family RNA polymerase sigma factor [Actinomycetota bacterium]
MPRDPLADPQPLIRRVYSFVAFHMGHGAEAEDVTSDVFERAVRYRESYDPAKGAPITWLLGIARRSIAAAGLPPQVAHSDLDEESDGRNLEEDTLRRFELSVALGRLDERERELVAMRYGAGLSSREIGAVLELDPNAVDVAIHRARARLKEALGPGRASAAAPTARTRSAPAER